MAKHILVCDDDEGIVDVTRIILQEKGYNVSVVMSSEHIFKVIQEKRPDLILVDLWMPEIGGDEVTKKLKAAKETKQIPVIVVSANRDTEKIAVESGADDFICKPFDIELLENKVEMLLQKTTQ